MKIAARSLIALTVLMLFTSACGGGSTPTPIPTIVLDAGSSSSAGDVTASGVALPVRRAELGFPVTGTVKTVDVAVGDRVTAGQTLIQLETALWEAEVKVADADLQAQQVEYSYLRRSGTDQEHLDVAAAEVARAEALLGVKQAVLEQATLAAPFAGVVVGLDIAVGETVTPGQVVLQLADMSSFEVRTTDLSERDAPRVTEGQTARVDIAALDTQIEGTVQSVSRVASEIGGDAVYTVVVRLNSQPEGLLWGMTATVHIQTEE